MERKPIRGYKGAMLRERLYLSMLFIAFLLPVGCWDDTTRIDDDPELNSSAEYKDKEVISRIDGDKPQDEEVKMRLPRTWVKEAAKLRDRVFHRGYASGGYSEVAVGHQLIHQMLTFVGPTREYRVPEFHPHEMKKLHSEALGIVQRNAPERRNQVFKDMEIYLVFKALYDDLSHKERLDLIRGWQDKYGGKAPPMPKEKTAYPLFWLRESDFFWRKGGRFWWWAAHALMKEGNFKIEEDGRVLIVHPDGNRVYTS